jgi:putative ubiquitin-RnfH superfamily antitoxin RatB of RatAB toxin-antitoxin module
MHVEVCYAEAERATRIAVEVPPGACVDDAVSTSGIVVRLQLELASLTFAVFGRRVDGRSPLCEGDRVELLRPLVVDPKEARRLRADAKRASERETAERGQPARR